MPALDELTSEQLNNSEILEKIKTMALGFIIYEEMSNAWHLMRKLENKTRDLIDSSPEIYKQYGKLIAQLKLVSIPFLTDEQIFDLIEKRVLDIVKGEIDIKRKIVSYLTSRSVFVRDQFKRDVLKALKKNQEKLGNKTLGEWLLAYDKFAGARKNTSIERTKFLTQNPEAKNLSEESKQHLLKILEFYDEMKISIPLPIIGVSEITLTEFFTEMHIPLPGEEEKKALLPKIKMPTPAPVKPVAKEIKKIPKPEKPKKPGFFEKLFGKKEQKPKPQELKPLPQTPIKPQAFRQLPKELPVYEKKISPYEVKREMPKKPFKIGSILTKPIFTIDVPHPKPPEAEEIQTFSKDITPKFELGKEKKPPSFPTPPQYQIRTMKGDIEKVKKQPASQRGEPIPPKPEPKIKDNIVDLSGK